jgi:hypothetical protein
MIAESKPSPIACNPVRKAEAGGPAAAFDAPLARGADWVDGGTVVAWVAGVFADGGVDIVASRRGAAARGVCRFGRDHFTLFGAVVVRTPFLPSPAETRTSSERVGGPGAASL